jgi:hypothetical protein
MSSFAPLTSSPLTSTGVYKPSCGRFEELGMCSDISPSTLAVVVWSECVFSNIPLPPSGVINSPGTGLLCGIHDGISCPTTLAIWTVVLPYASVRDIPSPPPEAYKPLCGVLLQTNTATRWRFGHGCCPPAQPAALGVRAQGRGRPTERRFPASAGGALLANNCRRVMVPKGGNSQIRWRRPVSIGLADERTRPSLAGASTRTTAPHWQHWNLFSVSGSVLQPALQVIVDGPHSNRVIETLCGALSGFLDCGGGRNQWTGAARAGGVESEGGGGRLKGGLRPRWEGLVRSVVSQSSRVISTRVVVAETS